MSLPLVRLRVTSGIATLLDSSMVPHSFKRDQPLSQLQSFMAPRKVLSVKNEPRLTAPATAPAAAEPKKVVEAPLKPITPEVEAKLEAARKAVAELVVAAEDAGLVETSINQPPILDLLITGRATDLRELKKAAADRIGVSPEVFGAWFTGQGKAKDALGGLEIKPQNDVRIIQPAKGLSDWYEKRANILNTYVAQARSTKAAETAKKVEEAKAAEAAAKKAAEPKKAEAPKAEVKKEEPKKK